MPDSISEYISGGVNRYESLKQNDKSCPMRELFGGDASEKSSSLH